MEKKEFSVGNTSNAIEKIESSGGAGPDFIRPSTGELRRYKPKPKKTRVVEVNEDNMYALVNEMYDLNKRSFFD